MVEGSYKDGKKDGVWTKWYEDGKQYSKGSYKNGLMEGEWSFYTLNRGLLFNNWETTTGIFKSGDGGNPHPNSGIPRNGRNGIFKTTRDGFVIRSDKWINGKLIN